MGAKKMKTPVGVLGEHEAREQTRRLLLRPRTVLLQLHSVCRCRFLIPVPPLIDVLQRLEIHFAVGAIQKRELARQSVAEQIARDLARLIDFRQRQPRQRQSSRRSRDWRFGFYLVPTFSQLASEFFVAARPLYLIEDELVILLDRLNNLSKLAHDFFSDYARAEDSRLACHGRRASSPPIGRTRPVASLSVLLRQLRLDRQDACLP